MQPKPTSLEVFGDGSGNGDGNVGRQATAGLRANDANKDGGATRQPNPGQNPDAKAKDAKPAAERKRTRNLSEDKRFKLFSGTANRPLPKRLARHIGVQVGEAKLQRFADGEVYFQLLENVRGVDVFVVQPTCYPVDQNLVELFVMIDALKRASAARITVVVPYYGYARQDRKDRPRVAISAKLIADLLTTAGANRALFVDLHAAQIQGFFNIPVDHLFASPVLVSYFRELNLPNLIVVSPDAGGVERARHFAQKMGAPLAIVDKRRTDINVAEVMNVVGDVEGKSCLIIDDIIDTAGTLVKTVDALYANGAAAFTPAPATPCFPDRPSTASPTRASNRWSSPTPFRCAKRHRSCPRSRCSPLPAC